MPAEGAVFNQNILTEMIMENDKIRPENEMFTVMFYAFTIMLIYITICILMVNIN